jgi:hypothetical protein
MVGNHRVFGRAWDNQTRNQVVDAAADTGQIIISKKGNGTKYVLPDFGEED